MKDREYVIDELFSQAVDLSTADREQFLAEPHDQTASFGGNGIIEEVRALLADYDQAEAKQFLHKPLDDGHKEQSLSDGQDFEGYRVINLIAEGGMSEVYLANDPDLDRKVALKLIKSHLKRTELLRRFHNERQILANLQHANIARLFEAGVSAEGWPFFVMEYVKGHPIDKFANDRELSIAERLNLFRTVCAAVSYAHQNLVVHRDIKPSNILVTNEGEPRLLDFGIAKLLHEGEQTDATATMFRAMTPEFASPEQVKGETVTTSSDVYSLGVLLYELLTGQSPYRLKRRTAGEFTRAICEQEPTKPSSVRIDAEIGGHGDTETNQISASARLRVPASALRGDLDNIILKALRKEPPRRYASVEQFSEDVRRYLEGLPVRARKDTLVYRSSKFIRRNRISVAALVLLVFTLLGAFISTAWAAHMARVERARAERRFNDVRELVNSLLFQLHDEIEKLPGSTRARELLVTQTLDYLDNVSKEASGDMPLQQEIATGYEKLGDVQSKLNAPNLGDTKGALASYRKALEIRQVLFAASPNIANGLALAAGYDRVGDMLSKTNNANGALENHLKSLGLVEKLPGQDQPAVRSALGYSSLTVARAYLATGDLPASLTNFRKSQATREALAAETPQDDSLRRGLVSTYDGVGYVLSLYGKPAEALNYYRKSQAISESLVAADPTNADYRRVEMDTYEWIGITLGEMGDNHQGLEYHQRALALSQALLAADPANAQAHNDIADIYFEIGNTLARLARFKEALESFRQSLENYQGVSDTDPNDTYAQRQVSVAYRQTGSVLLANGNSQGALEDFRKSLAVFLQLAQADPNNAETKYHLAITYRKIGEALQNIGDTSGALDNYQKALPLFEGLVAQASLNAKARADLAMTYEDLGLAESNLAANSRADLWPEAREWYQKSLEIWEQQQSAGTLSFYHAGKPEDVAKEITKCDAALAK